MQKIKNPFICWLVLFAVAFRPAPAQALLPAIGLALLEEAAIGAAVATGAEFASAAYDYYKSGGVPVQDYYAPTAGMKYADSYNASGSTATVNTTKKTITRPVQAIKTFPPSAPGGKSYHFGKQTAVGVGVAALIAWISKNPNSAPITNGAISNSSFPVPLPAPNVGDVFSIGSYSYQINSLGSGVPGMSSWRKSTYPSLDSILNNYYVSTFGWLSIGGLRYLNSSKSTIYWGFYLTDSAASGETYWDLHYYYSTITITGTTAPVFPIPQLSLDIQKLADAIDGLAGVVGELDSAIRDNLNPGFVDVPKLTQQEIDQAAAKTAELQAQDRADQLKAEADADPTNTAKQIAAEEAQAEAERRKLDYEKNYDQLEDQDPQEPEPEMVPPADIAPAPEHVELDFTPLYALKDQAVNAYPFNILSSLSGYFNCLVAEPRTPSLEMENGFGQRITMSFSSWDGTASTFRVFMLLFFNAACMYGIVRRWS